MASGALLLAISAIFATKANKKFAGPTLTTAYYGNGTEQYYVIAPSAIFTGAFGGNLKTAYAYMYCTAGATGTTLLNQPLFTKAGTHKIQIVL